MQQPADLMRSVDGLAALRWIYHAS
jgi:hypothetical protein